MAECGIHNYKLVRYDAPGDESVRYDLILLDMIRHISDQWGSIQTDRFHLAGFSGGAQVSYEARVEADAFSLCIDFGMSILNDLPMSSLALQEL